jgi:hypothetical protein
MNQALGTYQLPAFSIIYGLEYTDKKKVCLSHNRDVIELKVCIYVPFVRFGYPAL